MKVDYLRSFVAVAQEGNFTKASKRLCIGQPALTRQIAKLEDYLGARLFDRSTRSVELTRQGRIFLPAAVEALEVLDRALLEVRSLDVASGGILTIGFVYRYLSYPVSSWVDEFQDLHPEVKVRVEEESFGPLLESLSEGRIDVAIMGVTDLGRIPEHLNRLYLGEVEEELLVWQGHPFARKGSAFIQDIKGERLVYPYINPEPDFSPLHRDIVEQGLDVEFVRSGFEGSAFDAVASRQGIMGLPCSRKGLYPNLVRVPYVSDYTIKSFVLWNEANHKQALRELIAHLEKHIA